MPFDTLLQLSPELILLIGAGLTLILGATRLSLRVPLAPTASLVVIAAALIVTLWLGIPHGTPMIPGLWLTSLTFYTRCITLGIGLLIVLVNWHQPQAQERGEYMALILFSLLGVLLTASANDLIVLFFAIELVSVPTYVLIALSRNDQRAAEASVKYFFLGALAAAVFAYGLSFLYGVAGTTTMESLSGGAALSSSPLTSRTSGAAVIGLILVFGGLAFKLAAVPLHVYAADVYEGAASAMTGMLGFVPKFAGFVALIKILAAFHWDLPVAIDWMIWIVAAASMTVGNTLALLQKNVKRMLAYSSIAHTGYMLIALLVGPIAGQGPMHDGVTALLFYVAIYGVMNLGAFAVLAAFMNKDREVETLDDLAGLATRAPLAALSLAVCAFSLMGFPPTAGFLGKLYVFSSAFSLGAGHPFQRALIVLAIIGVVNSAIGAAYYLRIAAAAYIRDPSQRRGADSVAAQPTGGRPIRLGLAVCSAAMLLLFAWPIGLAKQARHATVALHQSIPLERAGISVSVNDTNLRHRRDANEGGTVGLDRP